MYAYRNTNPCNTFFMINMTSGMDHKHVHPMIENNDVVQHGGHTLAYRLTGACSLGLTVYIFDIRHPCHGQLTFLSYFFVKKNTS